MKIALAIVVVLGLLAAVFCIFARVLALMECTGGDISEEMEKQFLIEDRVGVTEAEASLDGVAQPQEVA